MAKNKIVLRTCIACRNKLDQKEMFRMRCENKKLVPFDHDGRSFYICTACMQDVKKLEKSLKRQCKNNDDYVHQLKEITEYVGQS